MSKTLSHRLFLIVGILLLGFAFMTDRGNYDLKQSLTLGSAICCIISGIISFTIKK